ncbi:MAG: diguanylate cyclase [Magnetococcales bacterium]|nr:diguanylate cyclase [Magnetococcales bacterium]
MQKSDRERITKELESRQQAFGEQLPIRLEEIAATWRGWSKEGKKSDLVALHGLLHNLAGAAGTFGFGELGEKARAIEVQLKTILEAENTRPSGTHDSIDPDEIEGQLIELNALINVKDGSDAGLFQNPPPLPHQASNQKQEKPLTQKRLFAVLSDPAQQKELAIQVGHYGYEIAIFDHLEAFTQGLKESSPDGIILDVEMPDGNGIDALAALRRENRAGCPTIFISNQDNLKTRLATVAAGGAAFCPKPLDYSYLIDLLDDLTDDLPPESPRVLIIEDSASLAEVYAIILRGAGMETQQVLNPLETMEPLESFQPDLILMDIHMPHCSGIQLAAAIRQQKDFDSIPIVYLSGETDPGKQREAVAQGGDEFLTKPIQAVQLISSVKARIKRYRKLRSMMVRDSMTGLYNHARCKELMAFELERAKREKSPVAFAMLDIDKFKSVNDTYGHPTGDRVIKSLARLLKQRLRKTDIVGRFGGEEFAVILPKTGGKRALEIMNKLREAFGLIEHQHEETLFKKTFSCGIAVYPDFNDIKALSKGSDEALYTAKNGGRNRVVKAASSSRN